MFASYNIPVLALDAAPVSSLVNKYKIGELFDFNSNLEEKIKALKNNYNFYSQNTKKILEENNWSKSAQVYKNIWLRTN